MHACSQDRDGANVDELVSKIVRALGGGSQAERIAQLEVGEHARPTLPTLPCSLPTLPCIAQLEVGTLPILPCPHTSHYHPLQAEPIAQLEAGPQRHAFTPRRAPFTPRRARALSQVDNMRLRSRNRTLRVSSVWQRLMLLSRQDQLDRQVRACMAPMS